MTVNEVSELVRDQIAGQWAVTNAHSLNLRRCLVTPTLVRVIERTVRNGRVQDRVQEMWLVLEERPVERNGYKIVFDEGTGMFGLASEGFAEDPYPVLCGLYGDFLTTFAAM